MLTLDQIALRTGTDQSSDFHAYTDTLDTLFASRRHDPVVFMEQGILGGASVQMWSEYFTHPDSKIIGVDIETHRCRSFFDSRIEVVSGSQTDAALMRGLVERYGPLDCCSDDGSHFFTQQKAAFEIAWPLIKPGGYHLIQDTHTAFSPQHCDGVLTILQYLAKIVEEMQDPRGATGQGKVFPEDLWATVANITFRKGLAIIRKA